jgi:hypothetical protein
MKTAGRENPNRWAIVPSNRALGAVGQNRSRSIRWAEKQEKFQPRDRCFFLTSTLYRTYRDVRIADSDGTISSRNSFPSPSNAIISFDGPKWSPVNSTTEWLGLSNTAPEQGPATRDGASDPGQKDCHHRFDRVEDRSELRRPTSETTNSLSVWDRFRSISGDFSGGGLQVLETLWFESESELVS